MPSHGIAQFADLRTPMSKGVGTAVTVRPSASANFFVDSLDKVPGQGSGNFTINKQQSLFNGFFNRIAVSEVVMDWGIPNVATYWNNYQFSVTVSGAISGTQVVSLADGFYSVEEILDAIVLDLNTLFATPGLFVVVQSPGFPTHELAIDQSVSVSSFVINNTTLARSLFTSAQIGAVANTFQLVQSPLVLGTRYIDIVSSQLTYNQDLKDSTTAAVVRDVLYRWYLAYDNVPMPTDGYGFPVLQGYESFNTRRPIAYPKQIRWSPEQPIGQVAFQAYDDEGRIIDTTNFPLGGNFQFQMSMLLSED